MAKVQPTSVQSYYEVAKPTLEPRQREVLEALRLMPRTDKQLAAYLRIPINSITPRRGELVKLGLVEEKGKWKYWVNDKPISAIVWGLVERPPIQQKLWDEP